MTDISGDCPRGGQCEGYGCSCTTEEQQSAHIDQLLARIAELEARQYKLAYAIAGGEDAHGLLDSIATADLVKLTRDERAQQSEWNDATAKMARDDALREAGDKLYERFYPKNENSDWTEFAKEHAAVAIEARQLVHDLINKEPKP